MELKELIKIVKQEKKFIVFVVVIFLGSALVFSFLKKPYFEVNFSLLISQTTSQKTKDFKYDAYYALKSADKIGDFILGQLKSPEVAASILKEISSPDLTRLKNKELTRFFKAYKSSPQSIGVSFRLRNPKDAALIIEKTSLKINENWQKVYQPQPEDVNYQIKNTKPLIVYRKPSLVLYLIMGLLLGIVFGIFGSLFKNYLK